MKKIFLLLLFFCTIIQINPCAAFLFKKKQKEKIPRMVETKQEWLEESKNVPLKDREIKEEKEPIDEKKFYMPEAKYGFEKYNYPQGTREVNIEDIKKFTFSYPYIVADINCKLIAYPRYYFNPSNNQISSEFYVAKLDLTKTKARRLLDFKHYSQKRTPIIQAGIKEQYPNLFNGLTLVDWSHDSKKLLIKEKVGSTQRGIYKTYLYVHFVDENKTIKLLDFDEAIKNYYLDSENMQLIKYRYDINPLGFSSKNDNLIVVHCFIYDKDNNKVFLGTWGYDVKRRKTILLSKTNPSYELSINGLILKQVYE